MKTARILLAAILTACGGSAFSQAITMDAVLKLSKYEIKDAGDTLKSKKWKAVKTVKVPSQDLQDAQGKYAHFTNCFFMLPEYKRKFRVEAGEKTDGVYQNIYAKGGDSIFLYYFNADKREYPAGMIYKTNRNKLNKITQYLKHNKYTRTFSRDSMVVYEVRPSVENVALDKSDAKFIEYYIDRCWKYTGKVKK